MGKKEKGPARTIRVCISPTVPEKPLGKKRTRTPYTTEGEEGRKGALSNLGQRREERRQGKGKGGVVESSARMKKKKGGRTDRTRLLEEDTPKASNGRGKGVAYPGREGLHVRGKEGKECPKKSKGKASHIPQGKRASTSLVGSREKGGGSPHPLLPREGKRGEKILVHSPCLIAKKKK